MKYQIEEKDSFNYWTVINPIPFKTLKDKHNYIKCQCKCGHIGNVRIDSLIKGTNKSCQKCVSKVRRGRNKKIGNLSNAFFSYIKNNAKGRGLEFKISQEYLWNLYLHQNGKCKISGLDITLSPYLNKSGKGADSENTTASLDRINPYKGYIEGNLQWVHKWINIMKGCMSDEQLISICKTIANYNKEDNIEPISTNGYMPRKLVCSSREGATHRE